MQEPQQTQAFHPAMFVVAAGPARGSRVTIPSGGLVIGRSSDPHDQLGQDRMLSRQHARITTSTGGVLVEDLGSTNGTSVNGHRIHSQLVHVGDVVTIGATQLQLVDDGTGPRPGVAQPAPTALITPPGPHEQPPGGGSGPPAARVQPRTPAAAAGSRPAPAPRPASPSPAGPAGPSPAAGPPQAAPAPGGAPALARPPVSAPRSSSGRVQPLGDPAAVVSTHPSLVAYLGRYLGPLLRSYLIIAALAVVCALGSAIAKHYLGSRVPAQALPDYWADGLAAALALVSAVLTLMKIVQVSCTRLVLARGVLQIEQGVIERHASSIDLGRVRAVQLRQTLLQRLSADGTLAIHLTGETQPVLVTGLARGSQLHHIYQELNNPSSHLRQRQP